MPHRLNVQVGNWLVPHGDYPKSQGAVQPPVTLRRGSGSFLLSRRAPGFPWAGIQTAKTQGGLQAHGPMAPRHTHSVVGNGVECTDRWKAGYTRDDLGNSQRRGAACQMKDTWQGQVWRACMLPSNICWAIAR